MAKTKHKVYTPAQNTRSMKPIVIITIIIVALTVAVFAMIKMQNDKNQQPIQFQEQPPLMNQPVLGKDDAPVTITEFGDYKCPSCKAWGDTIYPLLKKDYIDTGKVKFSYINVLFHGEESALAALAGESVFAQNPQAFWTFHKALFDSQPKENHDGLWVTEEKILDLAKSASPQIDLTKLKEDIGNQKHLPQVQTDTELVEKYRVKQTPTVMINGTVLNNPFDLNKIKSLLDKHLGDIQ